MPRPIPRPVLLATLLVLALAGCAVPGAPTGAQARPGSEGDLVPELAADQQVSILWESYNAGGVTAGNDAWRSSRPGSRS